MLSAGEVLLKIFLLLSGLFAGSIFVGCGCKAENDPGAGNESRLFTQEPVFRNSLWGPIREVKEGVVLSMGNDNAGGRTRRGTGANRETGRSRGSGTTCETGTSRGSGTTRETEVTRENNKRKVKGLPLGIKDKGVFSRFNNKIRVEIPPYVTKKSTSILVDKARRVLILYYKKIPIKIYPIALGFTPKGDKKKRGDGRTPEGDYYICEALHKNLASRYGARSFRLSYPNTEDARRGLRGGLITDRQFQAVRSAITSKKTPPQNTPLGSSLRIHGGGVKKDWTAGCIAMRDGDIVELYKVVGLKTPVRIKPSSVPNDRDNDSIPDSLDILIGAKKLVLNGASYKGGYLKLKYPMGDVPKNMGVCSDVVVRAFRNAGYDLQKLIYLDSRRHRKRYPGIWRGDKRPDRSIDHRRVNNLLQYFSSHFKLINRKIVDHNRATLLPGDVVFMDTLNRAGPSHVGIISNNVGKNGYPKVINNWTVGYKTSEMELLPQIPVTHHFRIN